MSELFEDNDEMIEISEDFTEAVDEEEIILPLGGNMDARRRLEKMLEDKRLRDELEDFID